MIAGRVQVEGLDELLRAFSRLERGLARELRNELRRVGYRFARDAKQTVTARGLVRTGRLRGSLRPAVRGATLVVRSSPPLNPGPRSAAGYASVYENGARGGDGVGKRAFLEPTLRAWLGTGRLERELEAFLDWVEKEFAA